MGPLPMCLQPDPRGGEGQLIAEGTADTLQKPVYAAHGWPGGEAWKRAQVD